MPDPARGKRYRAKQWRNGPAGSETARMTWWEEAPGQNIRLEAQDWSKGHNFYPKDQADADQLMTRFQLYSPLYNSPTAKTVSPVEQLLDSIRKDATDGKAS